MSRDAFWIQVSSPRQKRAEWIDDGGDHEVDLVSAIEDSFAAKTEEAVLVWKAVRIGLAYDAVGELLSDVMELLEGLVTTANGNMVAQLRSQAGIEADWRCAWSGDELRIDAVWGDVCGGVSKLLNGAGPLRLARAEFLAEWKSLLLKVKEGLAYAGYDEQICPEMRGLDRLISAIGGTGVLYSESASANDV